MWKQIPISELSDLEINKSGKIRFIDSHKKKHQAITAQGYLVIYHANKTWPVHRLVAETYIGSTKGLEVHHKNEKRDDPSVDNLQICTHDEHMRLHGLVSDKVPVLKQQKRQQLSEQDVHEVCKLLMKGYTYPQIREQLHLYGVTNDAIGKIATGKNWAQITCMYDLPQTRKPKVMNSYSTQQEIIGRMMNQGYSISDIADQLGVTITNKTEYDRLYKCAKRYAKKYVKG